MPFAALALSLPALPCLASFEASSPSPSYVSRPCPAQGMRAMGARTPSSLGLMRSALSPSSALSRGGSGGLTPPLLDGGVSGLGVGRVGTLSPALSEAHSRMSHPGSITLAREHLMEGLRYLQV